MPVRIETAPDVVSAYISGEIDHHNVKQMREEIDSTVSRNMPKLLRLDFAAVEFMDSSGIGLVLGRFGLMQDVGGRLELVNLPGHIRKVMHLAGIGNLGLVDSGGSGR